MDYTSAIVAYVLGGATVFIIFHKKILNDFVFFKSFTQKGDGGLDNAWEEFYTRLSARNADFSNYRNSIEAVEQERKRIGMNAHDELAAHITSLYIDLQVVTQDRDNILSPQTDKVLSDMRSKIKHTIDALRGIIHGLLPVTLEMQGLNAAVSELCRKKDNTKGTSVLFKTSGPYTELVHHSKLYVYRIVQELVTNALTHSDGWHIFVTFAWSETELRVTVRDNGKGLPKYSGKKNTGFGLEGIFIKSHVLGATYKINSSNAGMEFNLVLPLEKNRKKVFEME